MKKLFLLLVTALTINAQGFICAVGKMKAAGVINHTAGWLKKLIQEK